MMRGAYLFLMKSAASTLLNASECSRMLLNAPLVKMLNNPMRVSRPPAAVAKTQVSKAKPTQAKAKAVKPVKKGKNQQVPDTPRRRQADPRKQQQALRAKLLEHFRQCSGCNHCQKWREQLKLAKEKEKIIKSKQSRAPSTAAEGAAAEATANRKRQKTDNHLESPSRLPKVEEGDWVRVNDLTTQQPIDAKSARRSPRAGRTAIVDGRRTTISPSKGRLARVMQADKSVLVQYVARLGDFVSSPFDRLKTAKVVLSFENVDLMQCELHPLEHVPTLSDYPDMEPPQLQSGFYVDYRGVNASSSDGWWAGRVAAVDSNLYTIFLDPQQSVGSPKTAMKRQGSANKVSAITGAQAEKQGSIVTKVRREQLRIVCGHEQCRQRQMRCQLPQMWCVLCNTPVRYPGSIFFVPTADAEEADVGKSTNAHKVYCNKCFKTAEQAGKVHKDSVKRVSMPKMGQEHTATDVGYYLPQLLRR